MAGSSTDHFIVVAIDFGTTYSGYALQFRHEYTNSDPTVVSAPQSWNDGKKQVMSLKTPTSLLFKPNSNEKDMYGYEAERVYTELCEDEEQKDWFFFRRFKMKLDGESLTKTSKLKNEGKKEWSAIDIFARSIKCLTRKLFEDLDKKQIDIQPDDILYVLTVPAIWDEGAKMFMKEAARMAGIQPCHCLIALEPEAASLYCQFLPVDRFVSGGGQTQCSLAAAGTVYMVVDLGGGTADITVHEKLSNGNLREVHTPCGGPWGGTAVDAYFIQLLTNIVKPMAMSDFMYQNTGDYLDLMMEFETIKRNIDTQSNKAINIKIPSCLDQIVKVNILKPFKEAVQDCDFSSELKVIGDKLRISSDMAKSFFKKVAAKIVNHMEECLLDMMSREDNTQDISLILMVGGFSESPYMQQTIKDRFEGRGNMRVLIPEEAGLSVLKGAVIFGRQPESISSRILRCSYGAEITPLFDPSIHDPKKRTPDGKRCSNVFLPFATKGTELQIGNKLERVYNTINPNQVNMYVKIFCSDRDKTMYTTDKGCKFVGTLSVKLNTTTKEAQELNVTYEFGGTEMKVYGKEVKTGKQCETVLKMVD